MSSLRIKPSSRTQLQRVSNLHRREQRNKFEQMLVEGPQAVRELLTCASGLARDLYATEDGFERFPEIKVLARTTGVWTHILDDRDFSDLSSNSQGILCTADMHERHSLSSILAQTDLVVANLETADPGNLGTIIRTADAGGAGAVLVGRGSVDVYSPKVIRSTAGSIFHIPVVNALSFEEMVEAAHVAGYQVLAADAHGEWDLQTLMNNVAAARLLGEKTAGPDLARPVMWVLGNEARGFTPQALSLVDATVSIPIFGQAESLNVSVAAALCTYITSLSRQ